WNYAERARSRSSAPCHGRQTTGGDRARGQIRGMENMSETLGATERRHRRGASAENGHTQISARPARTKSGTGQDSRQRTLAVQPDILDRQIITLLRSDGRRSNREIARRLDVPEATVRYRVRRLTESGVLKISASVDPEHLGYGLTAVISVELEPTQL